MYWRKGLHDIVGYKKQHVRQQISPKYLRMSKKSSNFAAKSCKDMRNDTDIFSLESTLSAFFDCVTKSNQKGSAYPYLDAMTSLFHAETNSQIVPFALDDDSTARAISQLKEHLQPYVPDLLKSLNMPLTYLLDELICKIGRAHV